MKIDLPLNWNDEIGEVFDRVTVLTLKDAQTSIEADIQRMNNDYLLNKLPDHEREDHLNNVRTLEALKEVIRYFGG